MAATTTPIGAAKGTRRRSRATQGAAKNTPPAAPPAPEPAKGKDDIPAATVDLGPTQVTVWHPKVTLADGTVIEHAHAKYGHESEKAAMTCARSMVAQHGHKAAVAS